MAMFKHGMFESPSADPIFLAARDAQLLNPTAIASQDALADLRQGIIALHAGPFERPEEYFIGEIQPPRTDSTGPKPAYVRWLRPEVFEQEDTHQSLVLDEVDQRQLPFIEVLAVADDDVPPVLATRVPGAQFVAVNLGMATEAVDTLRRTPYFRATRQIDSIMPLGHVSYQPGESHDPAGLHMHLDAQPPLTVPLSDYDFSAESIGLGARPLTNMRAMHSAIVGAAHYVEQQRAAHRLG
jgi:hypothetical protein